MREPVAATQSPWLSWPALLLLSALFTGALEALHLSAAWLIGPMLAAIALSAARWQTHVPVRAFTVAQAVIGAMIARSITPALLHDMLREWPLFLAAVGSVIAVAATLGWLLARWQVLPGNAAIWGSFPGAATAMALMAEAFGADVRLVAFMQYLRVLMVALVASLLARWQGGSTGMIATDWWPALPPLHSLETLVLLLGSAWLGQRLRLPAGPLLLPLLLGAIAQASFGWQALLPPWLLALSYALVGWSIGQRFTRAILRHVWQALPRLLAAIALLIALCALLAMGLAALTGKDLLTAYLAMSPGGADSVAIIAASSPVDVPFVMAMQTARFLTVVACGPALARLLARRHAARE